MNLVIARIFLLILTQIYGTFGNACTSNLDIGDQNPEDRNSELDSETGTAVMIVQDEFKYTCCGFLYKWQFHATPSYTSGTVDAQVWRLDSGDTYTLVGYNTLTPSNPGNNEETTISNGQRIRVNNGDYIGLHSTGDFIITHENMNQWFFNQDRWKLTGVTSAMTSPYDWSSAVTDLDDYAINSYITPSAAPVLLGLSDVSLYNDETSIGQVMNTNPITATDSDLEDTGLIDVTIQLITSSGSTYFEMVSDSENITIKAIPTANVYTVTVKAEDPCGVSSTGTVQITILNRPPVINNLPDSISISEDTTASLIFTINATDTVTDPVTSSMSAGETNKFKVQLIPSTTTYGVYVKNSAHFDYDTAAVHTVTVRADDGTDTVDAVLTINIVKNEPPAINSLPDSTSFLEDVSTRTLLHTVNVTDVNGDSITCSLNPSSSLFDVSLIPSTTDYGIYLTGGTTLDYDTTSSYVITVKCSDNRRSDTESYTINLIRNTPPVINSIPGSTNISEDLSSRTLLHTINVTDVNGDNITCSLNSTSLLFDVSTIPSTTDFGIYLTGGTTLDYDTTSSYVISVECADHRRSDTESYTIYLIRNEPPVINSLPGATNISEDLSSRTLLHTINVTDVNGDSVTCSLNPTSLLFDVSTIPSTSDFGIYLTGGTTLDHDTTSSYVISVECADHRRSDTESFTIYLIRNEPPVINSVPGSTNISEDLSSRTLLHTINVTDVNGDSVTCSLNPTSLLFDVSTIPSTSDFGIYLTGGTTLDHDTTSSYVISVECADQRRSDTESFTIYLIRNEPPVINSVPGSTNMSEDLSSRTLLHTINVTDVNGDSVTCSLNPTSLLFDVSTIPSTSDFGMYLTGGTTLDYDTTSSYVISVECADHRRSDTESYTIYLIRNQPPTIVNLPMSVETPEDTSGGTLLYTVSVMDPTNDTVTCTITTATTMFFIQVGANQFEYKIFLRNGQLFSYDTTSSYTLDILCVDQRRNATSSFYIYILRNMPSKFRNLQGKISVSALATAVGQSVFTVSAEDPENDQLQYSMTSLLTNPPFVINIYTGEISLSRSITTESIPGYDLLVNVTDGRNIVGPTTLTIRITDINSPPVLKNLPQTASILEGLTIGTSIFKPAFEDKDSSNSHTFSVTYSPPEGAVYFDVNKTDGTVTTLVDIDYETISTQTFVLTLTVTDSYMSDNETLTVNVINVNEAPKFTKTLYSFTALENTAGTVLQNPYYQYSDEDGDTVRFSTECGGDTGRLDINPSTGFFTYSIDYDLDVAGTPSIIQCQVYIRDNEYTDTAFFNISIIDVNDNVPVFQHPEYTFFVPFDTAIGTTVGHVLATDGDIGTNGDLIYHIEQGNAASLLLSVSNNGIVTVTQSLSSYSGGAVLNFTVYAVDTGVLQNNAVITIVIPDTSVTNQQVDNTIKYLTFFTYAPNMAWFVPLNFILVGTAGFIIYLIWTSTCDYCSSESCKRRFKRNRRLTPTKRPHRV